MMQDVLWLGRGLMKLNVLHKEVRAAWLENDERIEYIYKAYFISTMLTLEMKNRSIIMTLFPSEIMSPIEFDLNLV